MLPLKMRIYAILMVVYMGLKWYYDQKITSFFPSGFKRVFLSHLTGRILRFEFYPKAVFFECKFRISRSVIIHGQD